MAVLPTGRNRSRYGATPQAPNIPTQHYGATGDAIARMGQTIAGIGIDLTKRQTETSENDFIYKAQMRDLEQMEKFKSTRVAEMSTLEDAETFEADAVKFGQDMVKENLKSAPTSRASKEYEKRAMQFYTKEFIEVRRESQKQQGFFKEKDISDTSDTYASELVLSPSREKALTSIGILKDRIKNDTGKLFTPEHGDKILKSNTNKLALGTFRGYLQSEDTAILQEGLKQLGEINEGQIGSYITPEQRAVLLNQFNGAVQQEQRKEVSKIGKEVSDMQAALVDGISVPASQYSNLKSRLESAYKSKAIDEDSYKRANATLQVSAQANNIVASLRNKPASEWANPDSLIPKGTTFNYRESDQMRNAVESAMRSELKKRYDDFPAYASANSQKVNNLLAQALGGGSVDAYANELRAQADSLGVPQDMRRFLPKQATQKLGLELTSLPSPAQKTMMLEKLQTQFGSHWSAAATDLVNDKVIPAEYLAASYMQDHGSKTKMFSNIQNEDSINKAFKTSFSAISDNEINNALLDADSSIQTLLVGKGNDPKRLPYANGMMGQLKLEIKTRALKEGKSPNASMAEEVISDFIDKNFNSVVSGNSSVMIPRGSMDPETLRKFLDDTSTPSGVSVLNAMPGNGQSLDDYNRALSQRGFWDVNEANNSLVLYVTDDSGLPARVPDKNGNPIIVPFEKINEYQQQLQQKKRAIDVDKTSSKQRTITENAIRSFNKRMGI